jgi:hypothetical protein
MRIYAITYPKKMSKFNTDTLTGPEYIAYMAAKSAKGTKYGNKWVQCDGHNFQSGLERDRYLELKYMLQQGLIASFTRQKLYKFIINGVLITTWRADFVVKTNEGGTRVEDVKGYITDEYLIKKRLMKACYGIEIYEPNLKAPATKRTRSKK